MTAPITLRRYQAPDAPLWNSFVASAKNATFLHDRNFMDYHSDRFHDHSLIAEQDGAPIALLPANQQDDTLHSHAGLTYGGLLSGPSMTAARMCDLVTSLTAYLRDQSIRSLTYKPVPHIFHSQPSEEDIYALFQAGARLIRCDLSSAIPMRRRLPLAKGRKSGASKARRAGLTVSETTDLPAFWQVLTDTLASRHEAAPVHSLAEIELLKSRFDSQIRLFVATRDSQILAGTLLFDTATTVHVQYIATTPEGRDHGALDLLIRHLLETPFADKEWFNFGISTTQGGRALNVGLSRQKEMFGARSLMVPHYQLDLA